MAFSTNAQRYGFLNWSTQEGLAQSQVRSLYQDHLGYLWIGTLGGVSRFDGRDFQNFSKQDGLLNNQVNFITQNQRNDIVFGSIGGITVYNGVNFSRFPFPQDFNKAQVNHIAKANNLLLISTERGLLEFDGRAYRVLFNEFAGDGVHVKRAWIEDSAIWVCTKNALFQINEEVEQVLVADSLDATFMDVNPNQDEWVIATIGRGLLKYDPSNGEIQEHEVLGSGLNFTGVSDGKGGHWLKSRDGLFFLSSSGETNVFAEAEGLETSDVRAVVEDREGNVWIGTNGAGIHKFTGKAFQTFQEDAIIHDKIVMDVVQDSIGGYWFATYNGGVVHIDPDQQWSAFDDVDQGIENTRFWCVQEHQSKLYFGSSGGLVSGLGQKTTYLTKADGLPHNQVLSLASRADKLFVGTARGLAILEEGQLTVEKTIPRIKVRSIEFTEEGSMWLATNRGVWLIETDSVRTFTEDQGIADDSVFALKIDNLGRIWIGTESGLNCIVDGEVLDVPIPGGFGNNHVNFIEFDDDHGVWLGTNNGLLHCPDIKMDFEALFWRRLGPHDGLIHLETNQNSALLNDGQLLFGTAESPVILNVHELRSPDDLSLPEVNISDLRINLESPDWAGYEVNDFNYGQWPKGLEVPGKDRHFSFYFNALDLTYPDAIKYQFRMQGVDDRWQGLTDANFTTYGNLSYESFNFEVRAIDGFNRKGPIQDFSFSIQKPIWLRWWFIALEVILVGLVIWLIYRARRRTLINQREKEKLEYQSKLMSLEQQTLNSSMNRHFIFNALNSIQYYINRQDRLSANKYLSSFAKLIRKNLDSSQSNLTTLEDELERLQLYLSLESMRFQEKFTYQIEIDEALEPANIRVPAMMLQPFLENSIWHGILPMEEPGEVKVCIDLLEEDKVRFKIVDNGIGIETSLSNKPQEGDHISKGMEITSGRIELIRKMTTQEVHLIGPKELKDAQNESIGTEVQIILPLDFQV